MLISQCFIIMINMTAMDLLLSKWWFCCLGGDHDLQYPSVIALTENKWLIHQVKPIPASGSMPGSCFKFCYNNERFYMWVTSSEPDRIHFNSSTSPLGNWCQSLKSHPSLVGITAPETYALPFLYEPPSPFICRCFISMPMGWSESIEGSQRFKALQQK